MIARFLMLLSAREQNVGDCAFRRITSCNPDRVEWRRTRKGAVGQSLPPGTRSAIRVSDPGRSPLIAFACESLIVFAHGAHGVPGVPARSRR